MATLMQASAQWASRPADERYTSLDEMLAHFASQRQRSKALVASTRKIAAQPTDEPGHKGLVVVGPSGHPYAPTHWSFGQLAALAEAPAGYLRTLPSEIAADCVNYGLRYKRDIDDVGVLLERNGDSVMRAVTGPRYGRIWNEDIVRGLVQRFGDGVNGDWRVPGEFGKRVAVTKDNTTLFAGDRDMFVFLADEDHRIEMPNRRGGQKGSLARGFFVWNSEVGSKTFGIGTFLFDYVCCNRIVWGAEQYRQLTIRHTVSAPDRWLEEVEPALESYANASSATITQAIEDARAKRIDNLDDFLGNRFGRKMVAVLKNVHEAEEDRPIETLWDAATAVTAFARTVTYQDDRVDLERKAGEIIDLA